MNDQEKQVEYWKDRAEYEAWLERKRKHDPGKLEQAAVATVLVCLCLFAPFVGWMAEGLTGLLVGVLATAFAVCVIVSDSKQGR